MPASINSDDTLAPSVIHHVVYRCSTRVLPIVFERREKKEEREERMERRERREERGERRERRGEERGERRLEIVYNIVQPCL